MLINSSSFFLFCLFILVINYLQRLELSSIWALLAAFEDPLPIPPNAISFPFEGAFVKGVDSLSWMANNTEKLSCSHNTGPHCWTFFSTAAFGKRNKVPQVRWLKYLTEWAYAHMHACTQKTCKGLDQTNNAIWVLFDWRLNFTQTNMVALAKRRV